MARDYEGVWEGQKLISRSDPPRVYPRTVGRWLRLPRPPSKDPKSVVRHEVSLAQKHFEGVSVQLGSDRESLLFAAR